MDTVVVSGDGAAIGTVQRSFFRCLNWQGARRAQIQAVRVDRSWRGAGLGSELIAPLATGKSRPDAHRFHERLEFEFDASHGGFRRRLDP